MPSKTIEGLLYTEVNGRWIEVFCWVRGSHFEAFDRKKAIALTNTGQREVMYQIELHSSDTTCAVTALGSSVLKKILSNNHNLPPNLAFFEINSQKTKFVFATLDERDRARWIDTIDSHLIGANKSKRMDLLGSLSDQQAKAKAKTQQSDVTKSTELKTGNVSSTNALAAYSKGPVDGDDDDLDDNQIFLCKSTPFQLRVDTFIRLMKIITSFPFIIVVNTLKPEGYFQFLGSIAVIRFMNFLVYILPNIFVQLILSQSQSLSVQHIAMAVYLALYLFPVAYTVIRKLYASQQSMIIEEGTFCFKPASHIRNTIANWSMASGFVLEWIQHCLYVIPLGVMTNKVATLESLTYPYPISFRIYFWLAFVCIFICAGTLVANSGFRGKLRYRVNNSSLLWMFYFNIGGPYYVSIVTIMFMGLSCDYSQNPPVLVQKTEIVCWGSEHTNMAIAALLGVAIFIVQMTLLPAATFKETMTDNDLDLMFVPVYLQAHFLLKAIFCGVYVSFYTENIIRCVVLTAINFLLLFLNNLMKPCSVEFVNIMRDGFFICAVLSGAQSLCYIGWRKTYYDSTGVYISTWLVNLVLVMCGMFLYYRINRRSTEYIIARSFLDLEWQVSRGAAVVNPRVLEPIISLTLSEKSEDAEVAAKSIAQLVWLISYPNIRVQFQSAWALANLAGCSEEIRVKINDAGGTKTLFEWYADMNPWVQLEALAALTNLTLSPAITQEMVMKYKCIDFFIGMFHPNKPLHTQFASIALGNIAREERYRVMIRKAGGVQILIGSIMSHEYGKRKYACVALANLALSPVSELDQIFLSRGLLNRVLKIASRNEVETLREVVCLIRNLSYHAAIRRALLDRGVIKSLSKVKSTSLFPDVREWCIEIESLMEREVMESTKMSAENDADQLLRKLPLESAITWSTWGSKLDVVFNQVFAHLPTITGKHYVTRINQPVEIILTNGIKDLSILDKFRDVLFYVVGEQPTHGRVSSVSTTEDTLTYYPLTGYTGSDFFTYRIQLGSQATSSVTVSIEIVRYFDQEDVETGPKAGEYTAVPHTEEKPTAEEAKESVEDKNAPAPNEAVSIERSQQSSGKQRGLSRMQSPRRDHYTRTTNSRSASPPRKAYNPKGIEDLFLIQGTVMKDRFNTNLGLHDQIGHINRSKNSLSSPSSLRKDIL